LPNALVQVKKLVLRGKNPVYAVSLITRPQAVSLVSNYSLGAS
jgi:hypothetical protein